MEIYDMLFEGSLVYVRRCGWMARRFIVMIAMKGFVSIELA